jgi:hypothetical protein
VKQQPLWFWGFLCIVGAASSNMVMGMLKPTTDRAEMAGRGFASLLMVVIGIILIIAHFIRRKS